MRNAKRNKKLLKLFAGLTLIAVGIIITWEVMHAKHVQWLDFSLGYLIGLSVVLVPFLIYRYLRKQKLKQEEYGT